MPGTTFIFLMPYSYNKKLIFYFVLYSLIRIFAAENNSNNDMEHADIRWEQRLENYTNALERLNEAAEIIASNVEWGEEVNELLQEGLIQRFEYTHELAWNVMKDFSEYQGYTDIRGSRDAIRNALKIGLIEDRNWMKSIEDRNLSSHDYDSQTANAILKKVIEVYIPLFNQFAEKMRQIQKGE